MAIRIDSVLFYQLCAKDRERALSRNWHSIKPELQDDVYEVKEIDGTFSYAFVSHGESLGFLYVKWMEEREYELHLYDQHLNNSQLDPNMRVSFNSEIVTTN